MKKRLSIIMSALAVASSASAQGFNNWRYVDKDEIHPMLVAPKTEIKEIQLTSPLSVRNSVKTILPLTLSVHTNLLYDAAITPHGGLELGIGNDWSVGLDGCFSWLSCTKHNVWYQHYGFDLYGRYWFGKEHVKPLTGCHVGVYAGTLTYDWFPESTGYQSPNMFETFRLGAEFGYAVPVGKYFTFDFYGGIGFFHSKQKRYKPNYDRGYYLIREKRVNLPDFTRLGITVGYTFTDKD